MRHAFFALLFGSVLVSVFVGACSSSSSKEPSDAGLEAEAEASADDLVEGCATFEDDSDPDPDAGTADRTLLWDQSIAVADDRCMQIKVGQSVVWGNGMGGPGDFVMHPLIPFEGDNPNPIANIIYATGTVTFPAAGTFGYVCGTHPAMKGAIKVVP